MAVERKESKCRRFTFQRQSTVDLIFGPLTAVPPLRAVELRTIMGHAARVPGLRDRGANLGS